MNTELPSAGGGTGQPLLEVSGLTVEVATKTGWHEVVSDVSFEISGGARIGLVGESGSGKTVTCSSIMRLLPERTTRTTAGAIMFDGQNILALGPREMRRLRGGSIAMVFQEPMTSLNPVFSVGDQISEMVRNHDRVSRRDARRRAAEVLDLVGLPKAALRLDDYPHQFSGGMRQRVMLAMALAARPRLLIADEPTTALDVTIQAQVLDLIKELADELQLAVLFVTHDLGVVADLCDRVVVMYAGQVVEQGTAADVFEAPQHPYTSGLMRSRPSVEQRSDLYVIEGAPPALGSMPAGCRFAPRCHFATEECDHHIGLVSTGDNHSSRCARTNEIELEGCE